MDGNSLRRELAYRRATVWLGYAFIVIGVLVNRFTLAPLSPDGSISGRLTNVLIVAFQLAMIGYGLYAVRLRGSHTVEVGLALLSLSVGLLVLELAWRVYLFGGAAFSYEKMNSVQSVGEAGVLQASSHPGVIFELRPSLNQLFKLVPVRTNSAGLRDDENSLEKPAGEMRVAVIGDSYTMASGVAVERAYPALIEDRLSQVMESNVEVLNFGVPGYTLLQYLAVLREKALGYEPDIIVLGFCPQNDHRPPGGRDGAFVPRPRARVFWRSQVAAFFRALRSEAAVVSQADIDYMRETFAAIGQAAREADTPVVIAYLSMPVPSPPLDLALVRSLVLESGLEWVDAGQLIMGGALREYSIYYPLDTHPNEAAHQAFAEAVSEHLLTRVITPDR